ncbi:MAG TPA: TetR/AcrR family transcriptional regulator [Devosiaceae bacterium]|jgi:AcrR family transcriptional regulator|nr:TetR/AcrR family transcriptional regulator [Devosiaceae bacterium]
MRKGAATRERILEIAEAAVLSKGFGATSIEELIAEAGITKSGFFYHFKDKNELALGLLERHRQQNQQLMDDILGRARQLSDDPLQVLLIGLTLLAERMAELPGGHPGCIVASLSYQDRLFDRSVRELAAELTREWLALVHNLVEEALALHPVRDSVGAEQVARAVTCAIDGGIILSKTLGDPAMLSEQILMARNFVKLLFQPQMAMPALRPALAGAA